jgi:hypothetical protein
VQTTPNRPTCQSSCPGAGWQVRSSGKGLAGPLPHLQSVCATVGVRAAAPGEPVLRAREPLHKSASCQGRVSKPALRAAEECRDCDRNSMAFTGCGKTPGLERARL